MITCIAGWSLGKASVGLATGVVTPDGAFKLESARSRPHEGNPMALFSALYAEEAIGSCGAVAATGTYAAELSAPILVLPEDACQQATVENDPEAPALLNVVSIGGRGYSALARRPSEANGARQGRAQYAYQFVESDKCSSGTGENIRKLTGRFGMSIEEADALAGKAASAIPITARCSVFAKSEMTHYANEGRALDELLLGYFTSVARNVHALLARVAVDGPIYLVGGCAKIETLRTVFGELAGQEVRRPRYSSCFEAVGAAVLAAERFCSLGRLDLPLDGVRLVRKRPARFQVLPPARESADRVTILQRPEAPGGPPDEPVVLGLDLGSTGAKAVLVSIATGEAVLDVYDRTRGNPVEAAQRLVRAILERSRPDVRAIALTGSGRQAVASLLAGVFPEHEPVVLNEIVAHATAAIRCDPEGGKDLSVIEIGGQDAKYIRISGGRIVESDLNKACSAGTGSFLEEQAILYDVQDVDRFVALAMSSKRPPDLGQMCTVFVADAASEALKDGFDVADIFAGFQYSVIHNYLNRVMGRRRLGRTVFFQGKPASNPSLAWTLAAVTRRPIVVPPNPGAMGAWGIGLCAIDQMGLMRPARLASAPTLNLTNVLDATIAKRDEFRCRDKDCQTLCPISRTTIQVGKTQRVAVSGGACPKFEVATASRLKLPKEAPDPFLERRQLLDRFASASVGRAGPTVGLPRTGALETYLPWTSTLLRELGAEVDVLASSGKALAAGEQLCNSFDSCGPAKIVYAVCDTDLPWLFFPKVMGVADGGGIGGDTCVTQQALPEMVQASLRSRGKQVTVLRPRLDFTQGLDSPSLVAAAREIARALNLPSKRARRAVTRAAAAQRGFEQARAAIGRQALDFGRAHDLPLVLVCGQLHVIHDAEMNSSLPQLIRQNGALAIPVDCVAVDPDAPAMEKVFWGDDRRSLRAAAAARDAKEIFPLMIASFGCGPSSFTEQFFSSILEGYPHAVLESDGHGGSAGYVTRIQAFLQTVRQFRRETRPFVGDNRRAISHTGPVPDGGTPLSPDVRYVFLTGPDYAGDVFAAVYRSFGYDAATASPLSRQVVEAASRDCSGKECAPYQLMWGAFRRYLEDNPPAKETRLVQACGELCRAGVMPIKDRISIEAMGLSDRVSIVAATTTRVPAIDAKSWCGLVAIDVVRQLFLYHRAGAGRLEPAEALYRRYSGDVIRLLEEPSVGFVAGSVALGRQWARLKALIRRASAEFAQLAEPDDEGNLRTVYVSGDLVTKGSEFANSGLFRLLAEQGIRILVESVCDELEFLAYQHPRFAFGGLATPLEVVAYRTGMISLRKHLYKIARESSPWLPSPDVRASLDRAPDLLDPKTVGSSALAVGSVLCHWESYPVDGVVMTHCWGCDDGRIEESLLRRVRAMPTYFHYDDGTPVDERRVRGFVYRLQREPARTAPGAASLHRNKTPWWRARSRRARTASTGDPS